MKLKYPHLSHVKYEVSTSANQIDMMPLLSKTVNAQLEIVNTNIDLLQQNIVIYKKDDAIKMKQKHYSSLLWYNQ